MREKQGINCIDRSRATLIRGKMPASDYVDSACRPNELRYGLGAYRGVVVY